MILMDTGPLVALFDPQDPYHKHCSGLLKTIREPLITTIPVLTEVFHLLSPDSQGSKALRQFIERKALSVWFMDESAVSTALSLMDLADASLVVAAQRLGTNRVFTVDRNDFFVYRVAVGHELRAFDVII
ncbi:type II toxin-antitoxin system VapC family toxin [Thiothrix subterranea]|uniref:PIN domain-containing protein n=2 Tax=Thiothrix subterranea TaxID=2735563 RepID=A0AA51MRG4_9GAMM|nr:PIN domain-containing protein [Thiothrix subterranea]MDQ5767181.1 PIN domain-containing protein [Thiothrix subterranea]WML87956.1 PIN domain-containing protein [Thiothrix subterranea]